MTTVLKFCAASVKLSTSVFLAADALSMQRPLVGLLTGCLSLVPLAWWCQDLLGPGGPEK